MIFKNFSPIVAVKKALALLTAALIAIGPGAIPALAASGTTATPFSIW